MKCFSLISLPSAFADALNNLTEHQTGNEYYISHMNKWELMCKMHETVRNRTAEMIVCLVTLFQSLPKLKFIIFFSFPPQSISYISEKQVKITGNCKKWIDLLLLSMLILKYMRQNCQNRKLQGDSFSYEWAASDVVCSFSTLLIF